MTRKRFRISGVNLFPGDTLNLEYIDDLNKRHCQVIHIFDKPITVDTVIVEKL